MSWATQEQETSEDLHVVPVNDLIEHDISSSVACICGPRMKIVAVGCPVVITHNSLDGRELSEPDYEPPEEVA